jgi:hypothetical protein
MKSLLVISVLGMVGCATSSPPHLMTFAEYRRVNHSVPYVLRMNGAQAALLYFGAEHIVGKPSHPQVQEIMKLWASFRPTLALNEGGDPPVADSIEEGVAKYGEPGLVRVLAARDGIPCRTFEPRQADEVSFLLKHYSAEEIKLFYVLRDVAQNLRSLSADAMNRRVEGSLSYMRRSVAGLQGPPASIEEIEQAFRRLSLPRVAGWRLISVDDLDPAAPKPNRLQSLNADLALFRDAHILDVLEAEVQRGERVFTVVGASHVVMQESVLQSRLAKHGRLTRVAPDGRSCEPRRPLVNAGR